jgi:23S rRNA (adenine-N6)-dimethyltransferase
VSGARSWGWHRLQTEWAQRIVAEAEIRPGELVVDLGAGTGALTVPLLDAGARVVAVELHPGRAHRLRARVVGRPASVVQRDLAVFTPPGQPFRIVANPPYALTAAVCALLARAIHLTAADLVLQRAVVHRIAAGRQAGLRRFRAEAGLSLPRSAFTPPPPVDSAVIRLRRARPSSR